VRGQTPARRTWQLSTFVKLGSKQSVMERQTAVPDHPVPVASQPATTNGPAQAKAATKRRGWRRLILGLFLLFFLAVPFAVAMLFALIYREARTDSARPSDAIIVLGTAQYNGVPSDVFQARLDTAIALYNDGMAPYIMVTGGRLPGDYYSEAEAGRNYLVDQGIPEDQILMESVSQNTWESMQGAIRLLAPLDIESVILVSDGFHLYRVQLMAEDVGLEATAKPSEGSPIRPGSGLEFQYVVREAAAVVAHQLR
jgi:uncharacterized SAM-binding protein YcdF (DUF218 family)